MNKRTKRLRLSVTCFCLFIQFAATHPLPAAVEATALPPRNTQELIQNVDQLRTWGTPWLRSLPKPLGDKPRVRLSGEGWLRKVEFHGVVANTNHTAPAWEATALDESDWEQVAVPEWNYAAKEHGKPYSDIIWYRKHFALPPLRAGERSWLSFDGVDWDAEVFLNGKQLASHQVYFEPFRVEVTGELRAENVLVVRVKSGMAFDEPVAYWSVYPVVQTQDGGAGRYTCDRVKSTANMCNGDTHAGDGCGIHRDVWLEQSGPVSLGPIYVRASDDRNEVRVKVEANAASGGTARLRVQLLPENFQDGKRFELNIQRQLEPGENSLEIVLPTPGLQAWSPDKPKLYRCRVTIYEKDADETADALFGARTFAIVSEANAQRFGNLPEGMFLLNGEPIFLRGANVQGLNALWLWGEREQLLKALLYLKAANFNALRACQHVCFPEVLELMDRLGILSEQDAGCRGLVSSGVAPQLRKAAEALTRVTYNHPGVVLLSFANECDFDPTPFAQASLAIDPSRMLLPISGQFHGPGVRPIAGRSNYPRLPDAIWQNVVGDIHPYWGWYGRVGELWNIAERFPPGRMFCIGEYGSEALDSYATMHDHYPARWKPVPPPDADTLWGEVQVRKDDVKMRAGFRGKVPRNLGEYIIASQTFQADQLTELTRSWRLSPRRINGYFQFHFMDVLPANWPKSILSHDFTPKPAFFAMAQLNQPLVPVCEIGTNGQTADLWIANDLSQAFCEHRLVWSFSVAGRPLICGSKTVNVSPSDATFAARVDLASIPTGTDLMKAELELRSPEGKLVARYGQEFFLRAWRERSAVFTVTPSADNQR